MVGFNLFVRVANRATISQAVHLLIEIQNVTGESAFKQDEYEDAMMRFEDMGVKLVVV